MLTPVGDARLFFGDERRRGGERLPIYVDGNHGLGLGEHSR